jgi:hypothetical protein
LKTYTSSDVNPISLAQIRPVSMGIVDGYFAVLKAVNLVFFKKYSVPSENMGLIVYNFFRFFNIRFPFCMQNSHHQIVKINRISIIRKSNLPCFENHE